MDLSLDVLLAAASGGFLGWFAKEIISGELRRNMARAGKQGVIESASGIYRCCEMEQNGPIRIGFYAGANNLLNFEELAPLFVMYEFELFNDSNTQIIYTSPQLEIHGIEGMRLLHRKISIMTARHEGGDWSEATSITVPAHGIVRVRCVCGLSMHLKEAEAHLLENYAGTVAQICLATINGKQHRYRIATHSFLGRNVVVWPERRMYPIYNQYSLNDKLRESGRKPQSRKPELDSGQAPAEIST